MAFSKYTNDFTHDSFWRNYKKGGSKHRRPFVIDPLFIKPIPFWKRAFDIVGSLCGLLLLSPLLLAITVLIKSVSPGPVLFKQQRVGCGGIRFDCLKFRTMKPDADSDVHQRHLAELIDSSRENANAGKPMEKLPEDDRIIKYGNLLRASGLDELPQLINVLRGQMSLIGPRPSIPYEVEKYKLWYRGRFDVMPGLTGLWQISGKNKLGFNEMIRLDIQYAIHRSFWLDCKILLMTPLAVYLQVKELRATENKERDTNNTDSNIGGEV